MEKKKSKLLKFKQYHILLLSALSTNSNSDPGLQASQRARQET